MMQSGRIVWVLLALSLLETSFAFQSLTSSHRCTTTASMPYIRRQRKLMVPVQPDSAAGLFNEEDSERLRKARLRLAEVQGVIPFGASDLPLSDLKAIKVIPGSSKVREISWRVGEPEVKYDPKYASKKLYSKPLRWLTRNLQIFVPITLFVVRLISDILLNKEEKKRPKRAEELLNIISSQSPALIKAGQALSSRSDLLPKEYLDALQKLQDRCPAFPTEEAFALFEEETGYKFDEVFTLDSDQPIAAASIGQVYKGRLKSTGAQVAIKVQRPRCEELIAVDLYVMRWYASKVQYLLSLLKRNVDLVNVIDDFGELLYREIDYRAEAVNAQRFAQLYSSLPLVYVPQIYPTLSTRKVLTMEWIDGARLTDLPALKRMGLEPTAFVNTLVQCSLRQMLENGFFHADPHAGNLLAMSSGQLCYLDFGMVSYVEPGQRYSIIEAVVHMVNRDFVALTKLYQRMGFIPLDEDTMPIILALENALPDVLNASVSDFNFKNVIAKLGDVMYKFPFSLPPFYIAIIRCLGVLEGLAMQVDANFRIISDAYPYIASRLLTDPSEELQAALQQLLFKDNRTLRWDRLEELLEKAQNIGDYDLGQALDQLVKYIASPPAKVIRENLAVEIVNGLDALESEAVDLIVEYARSGEISFVLSNVLNLRGDGLGLVALLERLTSLIEEKQQRLYGSHSGVNSDQINGSTDANGDGKGQGQLEQEQQQTAMYTLLRATRILQKASTAMSSSASATLKSVASGDDLQTGSAMSTGSSSSSNRIRTARSLSSLIRKVLREPVLQELLGRVIADLSERWSAKMVRRVFGRAPSSSSSVSSNVLRPSATGGQPSRRAMTLNAMAMAFFGGLEALLAEDSFLFANENASASSAPVASSAGSSSSTSPINSAVTQPDVSTTNEDRSETETTSRNSVQDHSDDLSSNANGAEMFRHYNSDESIEDNGETSRGVNDGSP